MPYFAVTATVPGKTFHRAGRAWGPSTEVVSTDGDDSNRLSPAQVEAIQEAHNMVDLVVTPIAGPGDADGLAQHDRNVAAARDGYHDAKRRALEA